MIRALAVLVAALSITPAFAQEPTRVGAVNLAYIARSSKDGKATLAEIEKFVKQKESEAATKATELEQDRVALQKSSTGFSPRALGDLQRAFEKSRLEFERFQQDARALHFVFGLEQAAIVWWSPAVDISDEVVKRLDAVVK